MWSKVVDGVNVAVCAKLKLLVIISIIAVIINVKMRFILLKFFVFIIFYLSYKS